MKKRLISVIIAGVLVLTNTVPNFIVNAEPTNVEDARSEYNVLLEKIDSINQDIQVLDNQISPLVIKINDNMAKIQSINNEIDNTNVEIEQSKTKISEQEDVLGERLREVYKSGGQTSYLAIIFSATSISDLISKIDSAKTVVELDNEAIDILNEEKDKLDEKVASLEVKSQEIVAVNDEIKSQKNELESKKAEQQNLLAESKAEQVKFDSQYLAPLEMDIVTPIISNATNSGSDYNSISNAKAQLVALKNNQLKSPTVISKVNSAISTAEKLIKQKKAEEIASQNRGSSTVSGNVAAVIQEAYKHLGKDYVWGAAGPNTFDCSGLTSYCYRVAAGINIGRTTYDQINAGVEVSYANLKPGDLIFPHKDHVGIYIGNGMMIHAPQTGDVVKVAPVYRFWRARRIIN